jgi:hypothetical protein
MQLSASAIRCIASYANFVTFDNNFYFGTVLKLQLTFRTFYRDNAISDVNFDAINDWDGLFTDTRHGSTDQSSYKPTQIKTVRWATSH